MEVIETGQNPSHRLKRIYIIALALIAVAVITSNVIVNVTLNNQSADSRIINIAGRQRMLSQKIAKTVLILKVAPDQSSYETKMEEFRQIVTLWKTSHWGLQKGDEQVGIPADNNSGTIIEMFNEMSPYYEAMEKATETILAIPYERQAELNTPIRLILANEPDFLKWMNTITFQYDAEASIKIKQMERIEMGILIFTLCVLVLEAVFIFRPTIATINNYFSGIQESNAELMAMNEELTSTNDQLGYANEQIRSQVEELQAIEEELRQNSEELYTVNENLEEQHKLISSQNSKLDEEKQRSENAYQELLRTKDKLVDSEKLAALGQISANVAHEVNTPLGAIRSSAKTLDQKIKVTLQKMPSILEKLDEKQRNAFVGLILRDDQRTHTLLSSKDRRKAIKTLQQELEEKEVIESRDIATMLVDMGLYHVPPFMEVFFKEEQPEDYIESISQMAELLPLNQVIRTAVSKASKVVFALKAYSRQEDKHEFQNIELAENIDTVLTLYSHQMKSGIELVKDYSPVPLIKGYPDHLHQVWTNLIHNALQAMNFRGVLTISLQANGDEVEVRVSDTGGGIPLEIQEKVFQPFFTTKPKGEGSGLGLEIVKKIVEDHHGTIRFESEVGRGTTFIVSVPIIHASV